MHELYAEDGLAVGPVGKAFPSCIANNGKPTYSYLEIFVALVFRVLTGDVAHDAAVCRPLLSKLVVGNEVRQLHA